HDLRDHQRHLEQEVTKGRTDRRVVAQEDVEASEQIDDKIEQDETNEDWQEEAEKLANEIPAQDCKKGGSRPRRVVHRVRDDAAVAQRERSWRNHRSLRLAC